MYWNDALTYAEFYKLLCAADDKGGSTTPPEYSNIDAGLTASGDDDTISYKDLLNGDSAYVSGTLNASSTTSRMPVKSYKYSVADSYGNGSTSSKTSATANFGFEYDNSVIGYRKTTANGGDKTYTFPFNGSVTVTDSLGATDSANASSRNTVNVYNYPPDASFKATTDSISAPYNQLFYYVGEPITIKDACTDYEDALETWTYTVKRNGSTVASSTDFGGIYTNSAVVSKFTGNPASKSLGLTFKEAGTYTITCTCEDELGKTDSYAVTIKVTSEPQAPTAIIKANDSTFANYNTTFTDASTDPNDDIVKWTWDKDLMYFAEVMDENGDGTGEGEWILAPKDYYTGSLPDATLGANGVRPTLQGTLQFKKYGNYRIGLTVEDATRLKDHTYKEVQVIEDIPIIIVDPQPPQPDLYYTVTFINSNDTVSSTQVKAGTKTPADKVPAIIDIPGYFEHGWTLDGTKLVEPTSITVNGNLTFCVLTTPMDENPTLHTVTFINTDGSREYVKVPHGGTVPKSEVPGIINDPVLTEYGWTRDGDVVVDPDTVIVTQDIVF